MVKLINDNRLVIHSKKIVKGENKKMTKIKYGRIEIDNQIVGYATFVEGEDKIELISIPYGGLIVKRNGVKIDCKPYVMLWTKIAGWIGTEELMEKVF